MRRVGKSASGTLNHSHAALSEFVICRNMRSCFEISLTSSRPTRRPGCMTCREEVERLHETMEHRRHVARDFSLTIGGISALGIFLIFCSFNAPAQGLPASPPRGNQERIPTTPLESLASSPQLSEADLTVLLDILVPLQLKRDDLAGATIAVVKDGKLLFAKGYGYADVQTKQPVFADRTLFRVGSISKLFTWTAVMQLAEQGKIDLDRDVNDYLDFKIPATFPQPITLRHLMTHTPGFEDTYKDVYVSTAAEFQPLDKYLGTHLPRRIFQPGTVPGYSNYGVALAGYIVQRVSGVSFENYVQDSIFKPLGMTHSTFVQPLPLSLQTGVASGYRVGSAAAFPVEFIQTIPAGGLSTCATDIARFMIAHLQNGHLGDAHILKPETVRVMHERQFSPAETTNGMALGFYEESLNDHRIIGHAGDLNGFQSNLHLIPDAGVGFFISYNSEGQPDYIARKEIWQTFLDRYFPYNPPPMPVLSSAMADAQIVSGVYFSSRRSDDSIMKPAMMAEEITVTATPEGLLRIDSEKDFNGRPELWREVGPLLYRDLNGQARVQFKRDQSGQLVMVSDSPVLVFQRASLSQDKRVNYAVLATVITVLLLNLLLWPVATVVRRHYQQSLRLSPSEIRLRILVRFVCLLELSVIAAWLETLQVDPVLTTKWDPWLHVIQAFALVGAIGTLVVIYQTCRTWGSPRWMGTKAIDGAIAMASVGYLWLIFNWNVLSFGLRF